MEIFLDINQPLIGLENGANTFRRAPLDETSQSEYATVNRSHRPERENTETNGTLLVEKIIRDRLGQWRQQRCRCKAKIQY